MHLTTIEEWLKKTRGEVAHLSEGLSLVIEMAGAKTDVNAVISKAFGSESWRKA